MAARPILVSKRLLAAAAAGLMVAGPALSQPQAPIPSSQRGAAAQPRQARGVQRGAAPQVRRGPEAVQRGAAPQVRRGPEAVHRGEAPQVRRGPDAVQRGAAPQVRRGPAALRGIRAPRTRSLQPDGTLLTRDRTLLDRNDTMLGGGAFTPDGRRVFIPSPRPDSRGRFLAFDDDDDDFRFFVDLGGGNVWISDDPVFAPHGYWKRHRRPYRRYWYPQAAYFPGTTYVSTVPYPGYTYRSYADTWPVVATDEGYIDPFTNPMGPQYIPATPPPPPRELTPQERAQRALLSNEPDSAVTILREHARTNPDDADAIRQLAVALLQTGEPAQAVAVMAMAYDKDPTLASRPIAAPLLYRGPEDLRRALSRAVTFANRVNTSSSWLLVATLMQAQGRLDVAERMLDRATALGLDERIGAPMRQALGNG